MNILIYTSIYPAPQEYQIPSDTKVVHYYAKEWKKAGHNVEVVYLHMIPVKKLIKSFRNITKRKGFEAEYIIDGISVHMIEYQLLVPRANSLSPSQAKNADKRLEKYFDGRGNWDKIFVHFPCSFKGIESMFKFNCTTMAVFHNIDLKMLRANPETVKVMKKYRNFGGRSIKICKELSGLIPCDAHNVFSGIDEILIPSNEFIEEKCNRSSDMLKIVYAGNLIKLKNVNTIIEAVKQLDFEYQLDIIGDGPEKMNLMNISGTNSGIVFHGRLSRDETVSKMREADVFVMVSSPETFGLVYIEAMAQGCITIGSLNEGIDGIIENRKNGFLVSAADVNELTSCFKEIYSMGHEQKKNIITSAYRDASKMTDSCMAEAYFTLNE